MLESNERVLCCTPCLFKYRVDRILHKGSWFWGGAGCAGGKEGTKWMVSIGSLGMSLEDVWGCFRTANYRANSQRASKTMKRTCKNLQKPPKTFKDHLKPRLFAVSGLSFSPFSTKNIFLRPQHLPELLTRRTELRKLEDHRPAACGPWESPYFLAH